MHLSVTTNLQSQSSLVPFCKLKDIRSYRACDWDLTEDEAGRLHWVSVFKRQIGTNLKLGIESAAAHGESVESASIRAEHCKIEVRARFDEFAAQPKAFGNVSMFDIVRWRESILRYNGFHDAFLDLKERENHRVLPLLPIVCRQLDGMPPGEQFRAMVEGVFAGNIFDMGAEATAQAFLGNGVDFFATRKSLAKRPWLLDDYDELANRWLTQVYRKAVYFIDNAGSDFLLGAMPMIRWLAGRGTQVIIAANELPALNDMTVHDVRRWWPRIVATQPDLADLPIEIVSSGTGEPLIDLAGVSVELNQAAADADLVILEGMGRGIETNLDAQFSCDALNIAMVKDAVIAQRVNGKVFDLVCRFR